MSKGTIVLVLGVALLGMVACQIPGMRPTPTTTRIEVEAATPTPTRPTLTPLAEEWPISPEKYVFIDHHVHTHGELIVGAYVEMMIDFPTYQFDEQTGSLTGGIDFEIDDQLKVIYGSGASLSGCAGGGAATRLSGVYEVPYERNGFTIVGIERDGTAHIEYDGESIVLTSGEEWVNEESRLDGQLPFGVATLTTTDRIVNYGVLDKSSIETW